MWKQHILVYILAAMVAGIIVGASPASAQNCAELRRACEMKRELGEQGRGNCRAYREQCTQQEEVNCSALRVKCMFKQELGEEGQGNCRAYRQNCTR